MRIIRQFGEQLMMIDNRRSNLIITNLAISFHPQSIYTSNRKIMNEKTLYSGLEYLNAVKIYYPMKIPLFTYIHYN